MKYFLKNFFKKNKFLPLKDLALLIKQFVNLKEIQIIKVVGTNGKGSVSSFLSQALSRKGHKVGLFTSPHLLKMNERIKINEKMITNKEFLRIFKSIPYQGHFFSSLFLVALKHFEMNKCKYIVLEAGIGGRKDATNVIAGQYGLVTSVSLDHQNILGNTKEKIAFEKAGIICSNMDFLVPSFLPKKIVNIFKSAVELKKAKLSVVDIDAQNYLEKNQELASLALKKWFNIEQKYFENLPGRAELLQNNHLNTYLEVAHNLEAVKETLKILNNFDQVVLCFKKTKDVSKIIPLFKNKSLFYYQPNKNFHKFPKVKQIKNLWFFYKKQAKSTLYIGSFILIGKLKKYANKKFLGKN